MFELYDEDCPQTIRDFIRQQKDIDVSLYFKRGLNGEIYFGRRIKMGDEVVLKFYWSNPHYDESEEAIILRDIDHPNILKIYDVRFVPKTFAYFLTPRIDGGDLQDILDSRTMSTSEALEIIAGILLGLTELHAKHNLVHRDLKPGNILLDLGSGRPIIADLGAVKKIAEADTPVTASKSTYYYLPPESVISDEYYYQSDIYQVGLIMFQVLGGQFPIDDDSRWLTKRELVQLEGIRNDQVRFDTRQGFIGDRIIKGKIANLSTLPFYLDTPFKRTVTKAIHPEYQKRYLNSALFLREVHRLLREHPNYRHNGDQLLAEHSTGKCFRVCKGIKGEWIVEKSVKTGVWRKDNGHDGTVQSVLSLIRTK